MSVWNNVPATLGIDEKDSGLGPITDVVHEILLAASVLFRCLQRGMAEKKLDLLEFAATTMADSRPLLLWMIGQPEPTGRHGRFPTRYHSVLVRLRRR